MKPAPAPNVYAPPLRQGSKSPPGTLLHKMLLACGVLSSLLYVAMNVFVPMVYEGYSPVTQTVSELSAIGAPTRQLWVLLGTVYTLLVAAFGLGVWRSAGRSGPLHLVGGLMIVQGILGFFWPPMHVRGSETTLTDTMHIAFTMATLLLMMLSIGFGAAALGKAFRLYSILTMVALVAFGYLTGLEAPNIETNLPTPMIGVWERTNIGVYMLWVIVLAIMLLRAPSHADSRGDAQ